jgi:rare lipoprotein A
LKLLDSRFRGNDGSKQIQGFYGFITYENIAKCPFRPIASLLEKFYHWNISHMPSVKFSARLDLEPKSSFFKAPISSAIRLTLFYGILCLLVATFIGACSSSPPRRTGDYEVPTQRPYTIKNKTYYPIASAEGYREKGIASWYGTYFHGRPTANGETYDMNDMTAAHKTLPMDTMVLVKNLENGRETVVRINDRGPFIRGRIIDLSRAAARDIGMLTSGIARVQVVAIDPRSQIVVRQAQERQAPVRQDYYFVQIASFTNPTTARTLQQRFIDAGHHAEVLARGTNTNRTYDVQVYVGTTMEQADKARLLLEKKGYHGAFVVPRTS